MNDAQYLPLPQVWPVISIRACCQWYAKAELPSEVARSEGACVSLQGIKGLDGAWGTASSFKFLAALNTLALMDEDNSCVVLR